jgi:hypothetical protein
MSLQTSAIEPSVLPRHRRRIVNNALVLALHHRIC